MPPPSVLHGENWRRKAVTWLSRGPMPMPRHKILEVLTKAWESIELSRLGCNSNRIPGSQEVSKFCSGDDTAPFIGSTTPRSIAWGLSPRDAGQQGRVSNDSSLGNSYLARGCPCLLAMVCSKTRMGTSAGFSSKMPPDVFILPNFPITARWQVIGWRKY